ncbi:Ribonuclease P/MRP [Macleaya cordata]|uniref:Ribonuclease P/MRP n=1 Tax=Macleaya cordata TaxID=56857 RepID=A0A200PP97_MACCD|nr:Ribonuclease P/MRP [Macleaya cordata]
MAIEGIGQSRISATQPPRTLHVQKFAESRASELESLHSIVSSQLKTDFRSQRNKRRRTLSYDNCLTKNKWRKRQKLGIVDKVETLTSDKDQKKVPRRVLRRIGLTRNPETGFCTSGDGTKRLRTHLWHAKRFLITKRWGFYLPQGLQGRWSIILPLSWVKDFWVPLVSNGARAIGFQEKHQITCNVGLPSFPLIFLIARHTHSSSLTKPLSYKKVELRRLAMTPPRVPVPPPWGNVRFAFEQGLISVGDIQASNENICSGEMGPANSFVDSDINSCDSRSLEQANSFSEGFVARTCNMLTNYLSDVHRDDLLLFPNVAMRKTGFSKMMLNDEGKPSRRPEVANQILVDQKLCFIRVHLWVYKEGAFEEGAMVLAPHLSDLSKWISRSDEDEGGLQIPQSSMTSYFTQQPSGKWELEKPKDPVTRESHRWPIGCITTGFVRGSTKPAAEAFCEASLLSQVRVEQWGGMQQRKQEEQEIFVLIRNLRSAAYRLALATIILEQQEEDVEFM